ncbi:hypothetical protein RRG44_00825 [Mycoplasmopsis cynos]|uniref:hypothetical protein n=1 Tax=Mycoplasmopsis cynos TaxID=171284 RepID=UPI002AFEB410|nr:hypothetical protein [Mycoplasmopsis cynos]WQQ19362.1 hypothetical protein RRG44_00825 [Mycoplasmopsis cynos]
MKKKLNILFNSTITVLLTSFPIVGISQNNNVSNNENSNVIENVKKELKNKNRVTKLITFLSPPRPTMDDFNDEESLKSFFEIQALDIHYNILHSYKLFKKIINHNEKKILKLPFQEFTKDLKIFNADDFKDSSSYNFSLIDAYWDSFIQGYEQINYNYEEFLNMQRDVEFRKVKTVENEFKQLFVYNLFQSKYEDVFLLKIIALEFEAIELLKKHKDNVEIKNKVLDLLKITDGINPSLANLSKTLQLFQPIITEIRKLANENIGDKLSKQVDEELKQDKARLDALLAAAMAKGSEKYDKEIKPRIKGVQKNTSISELNKLRDDAEFLFYTEKYKVNELLKEIITAKSKDEFTKEFEKVRNINDLKKLNEKTTSHRIEELKKEVQDLITKIDGSESYGDYNSRFKIPNLNIEQLKALKQEVENEFLDEKQKALNAINKILEKNVKDEELKKVDKAKNITELKSLAQNATRIRNNEDLLNARADAKKAVERTKGSKNYNEYEERRITSDGETAKLLALINDANGEYEAKSNEVKANIDSLDDKKDFEDEFKNVKNIADLEELNKKILPEKKIQDLARAQKRAKTAVESTNGSKQYEAFLKRLNNNNEKTDELNKLASEAENVYNDEKQKVVDVFDKLLDKKQYKDKIDKAINIKSLKALFIEISTEKARQDTADAIKKIEGSKKHQEQMKNFEKNRENIEELKKITEKAKEEFNNVLKEVQIELNKLSDTNFKKNEFKEKIQNANSIAILKQIKLQIQDEISEQQKKQSKPKTTDKKENENKTNVAAIVTPLVLIPSIAAAGFGIWYAIKHLKKSTKN